MTLGMANVYVFSKAALLIRQESFHISRNAAFNMAVGSLVGSMIYLSILPEMHPSV